MPYYGVYFNLITEAIMLLTADPMCAWYVVFKGRNPGVYTSWTKCSEEVLGYKGAVHRKYSSYEQAIADFNSTINSIPPSKPSTSAATTETAATSTSMSYKTVCIIFLCAVVCVTWMKLNKCNNF